MPKVTVLVSAFNAEKYIAECIDSLLDQSLQDIEVLVFEDGSTDTTLDILESYRDSRLILVKNMKNKGLTRNLIDGVNLAKGEYLARIDADDRAYPERLQKQSTFLDANPEVSVLGCAARYRDEGEHDFVLTQPADHEEIRCELFLSFTMLHPTVMIRLSDFRKLGFNYDKEYKVSQDHELWSRASRVLKFSNLSEVLVELRLHPARIGVTHRNLQRSLSLSVRKRTALEAGLDLSDRELELLSAEDEDALSWTGEHLLEYESLLLRLLDRNRVTGFFSQKVLEEVCARKFRSKCRIFLIDDKASGLRYWLSDLRRFDHPKIREEVGLCIRAIKPIFRKLKQSALRYQSRDWIELMVGPITFAKFLGRKPVSRNSVLLVELNSYHGETLPGVCYYFQQLGYEVQVVHRRKLAFEDIFCRFDKGTVPANFALPPLLVKLAFSLKLEARFQLVFFNSVRLQEVYGYYLQFPDYLGRLPDCPLGYLALEHSLSDFLDHSGRSPISPDRLFQLTAHQKGTSNITMLNPHFFGGRHFRRKLEKPIRFVTVGQVSSQNRSFDELFESIEKISSETDYDFEVTVIGRNGEQLGSTPPYINIVGELAFSDMYSILDESHFFLPLLDPSIDGHRRYLNGETTGSRQLILGFRLLPILHRRFGEHYGFSPTNSVMYSDSELSYAMQQALEMTDSGYLEMVSDLDSLAKTIEEESLDNLSSKIVALEKAAN
ncbi:MAG: glycosyltransferase [Pseudomonadales bacterium]|nr:glycosyltransferase [Pseudomonadales bacterium]MBO6596008.1 glycosyltransferase [Pseudomonadales bacterium]MBO6822491.1 glycosyltransferase [Pseudomonadales bacterium]